MVEEHWRCVKQFISPISFNVPLKSRLKGDKSVNHSAVFFFKKDLKL